MIDYVFLCEYIIVRFVTRALTIMLLKAHVRCFLGQWLIVCNTLQHPATPCNTLQHPATPCSTLAPDIHKTPNMCFRLCVDFLENRLATGERLCVLHNVTDPRAKRRVSKYLLRATNRMCSVSCRNFTGRKYFGEIWMFKPGPKIIHVSSRKSIIIWRPRTPTFWGGNCEHCCSLL